MTDRATPKHPVPTTGWPRLHEPRRGASGLRIAARIDPDGTLLRLVANE